MSEKRKEWIRENKDKLVSRKYRDTVGTAYTELFYDARDLELLHGTYKYEQRMLELIRKGRVEELKELLMGYAQSDDYHEGKVADDALRQVKNIFLGLIALVGKSAAIPGGMPVEQAYHLIDVYSQKCEELDSIEDVYNLQYNMVIDFAERISQMRHSADLSPLIQSCINYIVFHLNEPIRSIDVINYSGMSKSFLSRKFKEETGYEIGTYITLSKIDEAKSLLRYTEKPIAEISDYLSFSSQPYFQNVFKKITGMTPLHYREEKTDE